MKNALFFALAIALFAIQPVLADTPNERDRIKNDMLARQPQIEALKGKGKIGEDNLGYLRLVVIKIDDAEQKIIDAENTDRNTVYTAIAKRQGTTSALVGKLRAKQIAEQARPGDFIMDVTGKWVKK